MIGPRAPRVRVMVARVHWSKFWVWIKTVNHLACREQKQHLAVTNHDQSIAVPLRSKMPMASSLQPGVLFKLCLDIWMAS